MKKLFAQIKQHPVLYFCLAALFVGLNLLFDGTLLNFDSDSWFTLEESCFIVFIVTLAAMLLAIVCSAPFFLCAENGQSIIKRTLLFWMPFCIHIILQTAVFILFAVFSLTYLCFFYWVMLLVVLLSRLCG